MSEEKKERDYTEIDIDTLTYRIGNKTWTIVSDGHVNPKREQLKGLIQKFETDTKNAKLEVEKLGIYETMIKEILKLTLVNFDYDSLANDPDVGHVICARVAEDLKNLFLVIGGPRGYKDLQQRVSRMRLSTDSQTD